MRNALTRVAAVLGIVLVSAATLYVWKSHFLARSSGSINVYDGFETSRLSSVWGTSRFVPGAVTMESEVVRSGHGAAEIVLHSRDKFEAGVDGDADSERAELQEAENLFSDENVGYEYSFSEFIPADFPIVPTRLVIAQWKQDCAGRRPCSNDAPVLAVRYVSGVLRITCQNGRRRLTLFETRDNVRGRWTDFRFRVRFSASENGHVQAWVNGNQVVDYKGVTAYPENVSTGYSSPSRFYFKMGLYRDVIETPMTIYVDEYRKTQLPGEF